MSRPQHDHWLAAGAIWGPGLFIIAWVVGGYMVPGYSPFEDHMAVGIAYFSPQ